MGMISGKFGVVDGMSSVKNWQITETTKPAKGITSNSLCWPFRRKGVNEWSGSFSGVGGTPPVVPGQSFSFLGYVGPTNNVLAGTGPRASGTAICNQVVVNWDWKNGENISWDVTFLGHLALTSADSGAAISDVSDVTVLPTCATQFSVVEDNIIGALTAATLTITNDVQSYTNSSTVVSGLCRTGRIAGVFDATLTMNQECAERAGDNGPTLGDHHDLKLQVTDSTHWRIAWMLLTGYSNLTVDRETGAVVSRTINFEYSGVDTAADIGYLVTPGGTALFGTDPDA